MSPLGSPGCRSLRSSAFLLALGAIIAVSGCESRAARSRRHGAQRLARMEVVQPRAMSLARTIEMAVTIEPMEKVDLCARVPGVVEYLPADVDIGRHVKAGEKLIQLAIPDLEAQKKQKEALLEQVRNQKVQAEEMSNVVAKELQEAQKQEQRYAAEYKARKREHERVSELVKRGVLTPERGEEAERQLEAAESAWHSARALIETRQAKLKACAADLQVAQSRIQVAEAEVHNLDVLVGYATLTAPFSGVITRRWVDRGATIKDPTTPLLTLQRIDQVRVLLDISERDVPLVNATEQNPNQDGKGDPVTLRIPALAGSEKGSDSHDSRGQTAFRTGVFHGHINRLAPALDPATRTMRTEVHLDNPDEVLRPGMYGIATVLLEDRYSLTIPASALVRRGSKTLVYHIAETTNDNPPRGVVREVEVQLGLDDGKRVEVRSGLCGKELLIAKGNGVVRPGEHVLAVLAEP
jgi:RND family efflux transporter MFP subunit